MVNFTHLSRRIVSVAYRAASRFEERYVASMNVLERVADKVSDGDPTWIKFRDTHFAPLAGFLTSVGLTPNMVSLLGLVFAVCAAFIPGHLSLFTLLIFLNLVCDGIDGVMARKTKTNSDIGSIIDVCCDTLSVMVVATGLVMAGQISLFIGISYIVIVGLYTIRSALKNQLLRKTFLSVGSRIMAFSGLVLIAPISVIVENDQSRIDAITYLFVIMSVMMIIAYATDVIKTRK